MDEDKEFIQAKDYAYRLLSYRQRSCREIKGRLEKKGFSAKSIERTSAYLSQLNYLNDENFARFWISSKLERAPVGWPLLRYQLRQKGVAENILEKVIADISSQYNEAEAARKLAISRRNRYKELEPLKRKRRLYDYLRRRGFSHEAVLQALNLKKRNLK